MRPQSAIETHPLATRVKVVVIQLNQRQIDRLPVFKENPSKDRLKIDSNVIAQEEELKRKRRDHMKQKYDLLLNDYRCADMRPHQNVDAGILMFKLLARKEEEFNPDQAADYRNTIVYHDLENHFWLYSNEACVVWRTDRVTVKNVTSKLSNFCSQNELVGVIKSEKYTSVTKTKLLTAQELGYTVQGVQSSGADKSRVVIQRYIKSIGSKAFKVRTVWKRGQPPYCFILTNKSSYYEYDGVQDIYKYMVVPDARGQNCTIFKTNKGKQLTDTLPYVENIVKYFRGGFGVEVLQIAADFIKDESGIWWMINIKSVVLKERISEARIKKVVNGEEDEDTYKETQVKVYRRPEGYQKIKLCRYCEMPFHSEDLTKKMTLKMVIELDKHLKYRGYQFDWLDRSERQFLDTSNLYEVHKEMVELNRHFEKFARHVGIPIMMDRNGQIVSITTLKKKNIPNLDNPFGHQEDTKEVAENHTGEHSESQYEKQIEESEHQEFDEEFDGWKVEELNRNPSPAEMGTLPISQTDFLQQKSSFQSSFRFIFFIQCINDIPVYQMRTHPPETYWIEVEVLDQVLRYKIEPQYIQIDSAQPHFCRIDLNRCSVKYFFSNKRIGLQRYINEAKVTCNYLRK